MNERGNRMHDACIVRNNNDNNHHVVGKDTSENVCTHVSWASSMFLGAKIEDDGASSETGGGAGVLIVMHAVVV